MLTIAGLESEEAMKIGWKENLVDYCIDQYHSKLYEHGMDYH